MVWKAYISFLLYGKGKTMWLMKHWFLFISLIILGNSLKRKQMTPIPREQWMSSFAISYIGQEEMRQLGRCANLPRPKPKALSRGPLSFSSIESKPEYLLTIFCVITVSSSTTYKCPKINLRSSELMPLCHMFLEAINQKCSVRVRILT